MVFVGAAGAGISSRARVADRLVAAGVRRRNGIFAGGALLTGKPVEFLHQAVTIAALIAREKVPQWMLVGELQPSYGEFDTLVLLALVLGWRRFLQARTQTEFLRQPVFCMIVVCWILGFKADRFWADWGIPAVLVWLTMQFEELLPSLWDAVSLGRLVACALLADSALFLTTPPMTSAAATLLQLNANTFLDASDPALARVGCRKSNGIFYSAQMQFFYNTFYANPRGDWRYILGLEPALMRRRTT